MRRYRPELATLARKLALLGATDAEMADALNINESTLSDWMQKHSEFSRAINSGKLQADAEVAERLYSRATGHSHEAAKIFLPAGATSLVCTRPMSSITRRIRRRRWPGCQPEKWKDRQEVNITGAVAHCLSQMTPDERAAFALDLAQQARPRPIDAGVIIEHQPEE